MTLSQAASGPTPIKLPRGLAVLVSVCVALVFTGELASVNAAGGWMLDDLFSLWASAPTVSFDVAFSDRILPDSNPPLYFSLLYFLRRLVPNDSVAVIGLNIGAIILAAAAVYVPSRRLGLSALALAGIAAFVLSGPVLYFASEGRSYTSALAIVFVTSWYAALAITGFPAQLSVARSAVLGCLAALTHVYAAIFCGSLAAGLVAVAITGRKELLKPGLALGISTSVIFGLWLGVAFDSIENMSWIVFSVRKVLNAALSVKELALGANFQVLVLAALLAFGLLGSSTRPLFAAFAIAFALFALLPVIVSSVVQPIIISRYWQIGAAALPVMVIFAARLWFLEGFTGRNGKRLTAAVTASCFLVASSALGFANARHYTSLKPIWRGADVVKPLLSGCAPASVHVYYGNMSRPYEAWESGMLSFPKLTGASRALFADPQEDSTPYLSAESSSCPVLGWAEHTVEIKDLNDSEVLKLMKIDASPDGVEFVRHRTGFVILKRRQPEKASS